MRPKRKSAAALKQCSRVLAPGGRCVSVDDGAPKLTREDLVLLGELAAASRSKGASKLADKIAGLTDTLVASIETLEAAQEAAHKAGSLHAEAKAFKEKVIPAQDAVRAAADELETLVADDLWPLPKYRELLFQY